MSLEHTPGRHELSGLEAIKRDIANLRVQLEYGGEVQRGQGEASINPELIRPWTTEAQRERAEGMLIMLENVMKRKRSSRTNYIYDFLREF